MLSVETFFSGQDQSRELYEAVRQAIEAIGPTEIRVSKSQIAFKRRKTFALVWMPEQYLHRKAAPLVLTLSFRFRDTSPRWKEIVEPAPGRFTHHLELNSPEDIDEEVRGWLLNAWADAA